MLKGPEAEECTQRIIQWVLSRQGPPATLRSKL